MRTETEKEKNIFLSSNFFLEIVICSSLSLVLKRTIETDVEVESKFVFRHLSIQLILKCFKEKRKDVFDSFILS